MEDEKKCEYAVRRIQKCHKYLVEYGDNVNNIELYNSCMSKKLYEYMRYCKVLQNQEKLE